MRFRSSGRPANASAAACVFKPVRCTPYSYDTAVSDAAEWLMPCRHTFERQAAREGLFGLA